MVLDVLVCYRTLCGQRDNSVNIPQYAFMNLLRCSMLELICYMFTNHSQIHITITSRMRTELSGVGLEVGKITLVSCLEISCASACIWLRHSQLFIVNVFVSVCEPVMIWIFGLGHCSRTAVHSCSQ